MPCVGHNEALQQQNTGYENRYAYVSCTMSLVNFLCRIITPSAIIHQPGFIGTYSYVQPIVSPPDTLTDQSHTNDTPLRTVHEHYRIPGSQIYKTLDKHIKELECYNSPSQEALFDDPNYSPVCSHVYNEEGMTYDRLATKSTGCEYGYSYVRINRKDHPSSTTTTQQDSTSTVYDTIAVSHSDELLRIAALGTYEMDPELISTLKRSDERIHSPNEKSCYQSLDQKTLSPVNSYTTINK